MNRPSVSYDRQTVEQKEALLDSRKPSNMELNKKINRIAPVPGSLVYVTSKEIVLPWQTLNPHLFVAYDVHTQLIVAKIYWLRNIASAIDFLSFIQHSFPFLIREIRTSSELCFTNPAILQHAHRFTAEALSSSILHSIVYDETPDVFMTSLNDSFLHEIMNRLHQLTKEEQLLSEVHTYLQRHNNHRSLDLIGGMTPIQKLRTYSEYASVTELVSA